MKMWQLLKRAFRVACIILAVCAPLIAGLVWWQWDGVRAQVGDYLRDYQRNALTEATRLQIRELPSVDAVEVLRLVEDPAEPGQKSFCKSYFGTVLYVSRTERLTGKNAESLAALWRSQKVQENGVMCHDPHHAVLFFHNGKEISRTLICFHCINAEIPCSMFRGDLVMFDDQIPEYRALKSNLEGLVGSAE